ncbi:type II secretion system protein [Shewanella aestuarii]|uniref:Prepilin-type N-terminal cleavage/methylation domain-containing protein n=1 Tax=Shewanella aestuarii TaxID=1028752 RepID=A0A6G9QLV6_9GAMM|nr:prepilin-type N-terminal cleavage/methylation domain-containing protein [Shewanella aestuarii]QIR15027.1 prepilin-type N-terminal cleavage/methylation domain-containing protein [Shewanella aestuarii]
MIKGRGFTLIELVVVIIILGILAVTAAPKFINLQGDARVSTLAGMQAALKSANTLVYSKASILGKEKLPPQPQATVDIGAGSQVNIAYGYLTATKDALELALDVKFDALNDINGTNDWVYIEGSDVSGAFIFIAQRGSPIDSNGILTCPLIYREASALFPPIYYIEKDPSNC